MILPWKKGPPPEGEVGTWLVWIGFHGARFARRDVRQRLFVLDPSAGHPPSWWEERITHHLPDKITPPGEAPAPPSPREGGEGITIEIATTGTGFPPDRPDGLSLNTAATWVRVNGGEWRRAGRGHLRTRKALLEAIDSCLEALG